MSSEAELVGKVEKLMNERFGGTDEAARKRLFAAYDHDGDGQIDKAELKKLLSDADVGNGLTRGVWVSGVMSKLDFDEGGTISLAEFESIFT